MNTSFDSTIILFLLFSGEWGGIERYFRGENLLYKAIFPGEKTTTCITGSEQMPRAHLMEFFNIAQRP